MRLSSVQVYADLGKRKKTHFNPTRSVDEFSLNRLAMTRGVFHRRSIRTIPKTVATLTLTIFMKSSIFLQTHSYIDRFYRSETIVFVRQLLSFRKTEFIFTRYTEIIIVY